MALLSSKITSQLPIGLTGATGPTGATGIQGASGATGTQGASGAGAPGATGALANWQRKTANYTAVAKDYIIADTVGGTWTLTLPASPSVGDSITLADGQSWLTTNLTVARNGALIEGVADDIVLNVPNVIITFIYDGTQWELYTNIGPAGAQGASGIGASGAASAVPGATGPQGNTGGASGPAGATGTSGAGATGPRGSTGPSGSSIVDDITTNASYYPLVADASSGNAGIFASSTKLYFNPSTGTFNATIFNSLSDMQFKENISTVLNAVEIIKQLNGVSFTWKDNGNKSYGIIAQEIEKVIPEIVNNDNDKKSVNYNGIIAFLIQAIKEQQEQIDELKIR